jgi:uncharacterized protein (DUF169 family)
MDAQTAGRRMTELLNLASRPVAVAFTATRPEGVPRVAKAGPAGCAYWKQAAEGAVFYTEAADHHNCPVGSFTHGITGLGDDELYFTIPGPKVGEVVERLETVMGANRTLETYHEGRRAGI